MCVPKQDQERQLAALMMIQDCAAAGAASLLSSGPQGSSNLIYILKSLQVRAAQLSLYFRIPCAFMWRILWSATCSFGLPMPAVLVSIAAPRKYLVLTHSRKCGPVLRGRMPFPSSRQDYEVSINPACSSACAPILAQASRSNPGALLAQLQAAQESPRQQLALMRMLRESLSLPNQAPPRQPSPDQPPPRVRAQSPCPCDQ